MACNIDSWFALSPLARLLCWLAATLCGVALLWWLVIAPQQKELAQLSSLQAAQDEARTAQWRKLRALAMPADAFASALATTCRFSPLNLPAHDQQLVRWQPGQGGGQAELETEWGAAMNIFQRLAECGMSVSSFSLTNGRGALRFIVQLEQGNGD